MKEADKNFTERIEEFASFYKSGEYVYLRVIWRTFKEQADAAIAYMVQHGIVREERLLRCPECHLGLEIVSRLDSELEEMECYHCDTMFSIEKALHDCTEAVYIKI